MKGIAASFGLAAAISVSALSLHMSGEAHKEFCAERIAAAEAPIRGPIERASDDQLLYALNHEPPACNAEVNGTDTLNSLMGGAIIGFGVYVFGLIFGKFRRWAHS